MDGDGVLLIGCGNPLRGDDGVGPEVVRRMLAGGVPPGLRCVDAGLGGIDTLLLLRGVRHAIVVDACRSGAAPGTIHERAAADVAGPPPAGWDFHAFRWDHALAAARWLPDDQRPGRIEAVLVEGESFAPRIGLSAPVAAAVAAVCARLRARFGPAPAPLPPRPE